MAFKQAKNTCWIARIFQALPNGIGSSGYARWAATPRLHVHAYPCFFHRKTLTGCRQKPPNIKHPAWMIVGQM
jgi:hypothetical protein